tara:strand:- start:618 stop:1094 length:477 start_codon:yes stop_codon:yes gene_type:complete
MSWKTVIKKEWDLNQRWKLGMGFQDRGKVSEEEIIRTYEYVLEKYNELIDTYDSTKTMGDASKWADEYYGILNMHYMPLFYQAKDSDNQHIRMLQNDIKDLQQGKFGENSFHILSRFQEHKPKRFEKLTAKEIGLVYLAENINDIVQESKLYQEGDEW